MDKRTIKRSDNTLHAIAGSPVLWGAGASAGFYSVIHGGWLTGEYFQLYFAGHPVEYVATTMFLVALAVLVIKAIGIARQHRGLAVSALGPPARRGDRTDDCEALLDRLDRLPRSRQNDYLVRRLRDAMEHVRRHGSAENLDEQLKYLADLEAGRLHSSYALVRVIIWAIPILGFLGTVIGITMAIANLAGGAVEDSIPQVVGGLSVAFATTTQALLLSIVLMFAQYYVEQKENALLEQVDQRTAAELEGRLEQIPAGPEGQLVAFRRMAETMVQASQQLVRRQAELWQASMDAAGRRWASMAETTGARLQSALSGALSESLIGHARQLAASAESTEHKHQRYVSKFQEVQVESTRAMASLQDAVTEQAEVLNRAVKATGEVTKLEDALNRNLATLAGAKNFEQTVMSLAAAIHLLNARLSETPARTPPVKLEPDEEANQAA